MVDREMCKRTADAFFRTACMIDNTPPYTEFKNEMLAPFTVNLMFSCELYLKYLLFPYVNFEDRNYKTHNISLLYKKLESSNKSIADQIRNHYTASFVDGKPFRELNDVLELNKNNFEDFRYLYENNTRKAMHSTDVAVLVRSLRIVC